MSLRAAMIRGVSGALYHTGLVGPVARGIARTHPRPRVQILTFHRVNDDNDPFLPSLPTAVFAARMAYIARHYRVMTVEDLAAALQEGRVPKNALAITFDDGYRDNFTHAAPILKRLGLPATIFLVTGHIDTPRALWFDRLAMAFKSATARRVELADGQLLSLGTVSDRLAALDAALTHLKRLSDDERTDSVEQLMILAATKSRTPQATHAQLGRGGRATWSRVLDRRAYHHPPDPVAAHRGPRVGGNPRLEGRHREGPGRARPWFRVSKWQG